MANVKSAVGGYNQLNYDMQDSGSNISKLSTRLAKAKSSGAGLGGLLGTVLGVALSPFTMGASLALAGAIGGGLGAMAGSYIGGKTSGVDVKDITGQKFFKGTSANIVNDMEKSNFSNILMAAGSGAMQAGNVLKLGKAASAGWKGAEGGLLSKAWGALGGMGESYIPKLKEFNTKAAAGEALEQGSEWNILDITKKIQGGAGEVMKGSGTVEEITRGANQGGLLGHAGNFTLSNEVKGGIDLLKNFNSGNSGMSVVDWFKEKGMDSSFGGRQSQWDSFLKDTYGEYKGTEEQNNMLLQLMRGS